MGRDKHASRTGDGTKRSATTEDTGTASSTATDHAVGLQRTIGNADTTALIQQQAASGTTSPPAGPMLTTRQQRALDTAADRAATLSKRARKDLLKEAKKLGFSPDDVETVKDRLRRAELTINFDASKKVGDTPLPELFTGKDAKVKNLFETGSSGGSSDFDSREQLEREMFDYDKITPSSDMTAKAERPKYAALNPTTSALGGADGSSYGGSAFVLNDAVRSRMTLTPDDSFLYHDPETVGTFDHLDHVLLARIRAKPAAAQELFQTILAHARGDRGDTPGFDYLEAQVHGDVDINRDVAYIRANFNEAFGSPGGAALRRMGSATRPVIWSFRRKRDEAVLEPTRGAAKDAFDKLWKEVADLRDPSLEKPLDMYSPAMATYWTRLIDAMPPMNLSISGKGAASVGQVSGRDDSNPLPVLNDAKLKTALGL